MKYWLLRLIENNLEVLILEYWTLSLAFEEFVIDFVDWCGFVLNTYYAGMFNAIGELKNIGLIESNERAKYLWKVTKAGREYATDITPLWWDICQEKLEPEHKQLLHVVNRLSPQTAPDHAWLENVDHKTIVSALGWPEGSHQLWPVANELEQWGFVNGHFFLGGIMTLSAAYRGLVWETRRGFTLESKFIDDLVAEWETTSVDFKRELYTDTADQKAELIKDVLSLVNTQASGRRWMIMGFDDKTHQYYGPPAPKLTQNHFEQLMKQYTVPMVDVQFEVVEYRKGCVGKLEVRRDPKKLPYSVAMSITGDKKKVSQGQIFVRHGSQVEEPTLAELEAIREEADRASGQSD